MKLTAVSSKEHDLAPQWQQPPAKRTRNTAGTGKKNTRGTFTGCRPVWRRGTDRSCPAHGERCLFDDAWFLSPFLSRSRQPLPGREGGFTGCSAGGRGRSAELDQRDQQHKDDDHGEPGYRSTFRSSKVAVSRPETRHRSAPAMAEVSPGAWVGRRCRFCLRQRYICQSAAFAAIRLTRPPPGDDDFAQAGLNDPLAWRRWSAAATPELHSWCETASVR